MIPNKFVESIIEQVNPLMLPKEDGTAFVFDNLRSAYLYVMDKCLEIAPKGYVDLLLILTQLYGWKKSKALTFYEHHMKQRMGSRVFLLKLGDSKAKTFFRKFLFILSEYYKTDFDIYAFEQAYTLHKNHLLCKDIIFSNYEQGIENQTKGNTK